MSKYFKIFFNHQKALWNDEAVNPKPISWIASFLFVPSIIFSYYLGKYLNQEIILYLDIPRIIKMLIMLLIYVFLPLIIPCFIGNNAK